ncbi:ROK family protein [Fictibacillus nanhaiensis]|uniref:ROK family protein n=1 Tax=Fictibacillus nanhaiensis TaxID=742169 RepID=UPI001C94EE60|nr:ROK family protein [Fictibacillus nanhaiensis]MBY6037068.1 ROK family protein [Fictibacillus nanhaiensis]
MKRRYILAADVGGTTIECALFHMDGEILNRKTLMTSEVIQSDVAECIADEMRRRLMEHEVSMDEVCCIGLGVPGLVDTETGMVFKAPSLEWNHYPLGEKIERILGIPVVVGNDVNTGLLGEVEKGSLQNVKHAVFCMVGTSIGAGLLINNQVYEGSRFSAGEMGYMITEQNALNDGFTPARRGYGFLSTQSGGFGMSHKYEMKTGQQGVSTQELFLLANQGNLAASQVVEEAISHLSTALVNMTVLLNPEVILFGGGVGRQLQPFLEKIDQNLEKYVPFKPELRISSMGNRSVLYGAFSLCRRRLDRH